MEKDEDRRSEFEIEHGFSNRKELRKNVLRMFDELDDYEFHNLYGILWTLTANKILIRSKEASVSYLKHRLERYEKTEVD